ncbi:hypothetical protein IU500_26270 [Nocardia terpenica]|uniref:Uncharacterized protein n=1 Tax=Nocardia terpenica TaxID=455432 RepID=A0A164I7I0_9NOCA|nr:hypothetical protein [Nocardia terpenica]KZM69171.1 hypothetical protein AWN90_15760 [Nocardia terpenica]MBF6061687.1 hypothetical protein [Nocardia terpenica]MBF6107518.1 hypothetical protein [Nocardia terpenica]MBF6110107.1 hypothetical protein [Nocardia terpenica]MBF6122381.1 hypothetical protein [Nocardia terpenica]
MQRTEFRGDIATGDHENAQAILRTWLSADELTMKSHRSRWEVSYRDDTLELYCYQAKPPAGTAYSFFVLEGDLHGPTADAAARLETLGRLCRERGLPFEIDYVEVDADGEPLGEELTIS